jgi:hypothetical protein
MKTQELNAKELMEINGGGLFGGDSASQSGLAGGLGIGNLLSFSTASQDGDESSASSLSLGNGISASLSQITNSLFN